MEQVAASTTVCPCCSADGSLVPRENATEMQRLVAYEDHECTPSLTAGEKREAAALLKRAAPIKA